MKNVEIFWITSAYPFCLQVTLSDPKVLKKPEEKSAMGPILRVLCHDYCQSQSMRFQWKIKDIWLAVDVRHSFSLPLPKCKQKYGRNAFKIAELTKPCGHCGEARRRPIWPKQPPVPQLLAFGRHGSKEQLDIEQYVWEDRFWTSHLKLISPLNYGWKLKTCDHLFISLYIFI